MPSRPWLNDVHPLYEAKQPTWLRNERRYRGGTHVLGELRPFDWETLIGEAPILPAGADVNMGKDDVSAHMRIRGQHYAMRQNMALYVRFPKMFMAGLAGHLLRKAPSPEKGIDFGPLGKVRRKRRGTPTNAELLYFNTNGVGNQGSQWNPFWGNVVELSGATGHRWMFAEASIEGGKSEKDVLLGKRPWLVHLSPTVIPNWDFIDGNMAFAVHKLGPGRVFLEHDRVKRDLGPKRLYVRRGFDGLGSEFIKGGWWTFKGDGDFRELPGDQGTWDSTDGEIPMWAHFYERDEENFSRPGIDEIGNAAIAFMNLQSAAAFDAWDAAKSELHIFGIDPAAFEVALEKRKSGSQWIPWPNNSDTGVAPVGWDSSAGAVQSQVFQTALTMIRETVREITGLEASGTPDSSGVSKMVGFAEGKSPRLALLAAEVEGSQNIALKFLCDRWGFPGGSAQVEWTRDFDLAPILSSLESLFNLETAAGIRSKTVAVKGLMAANREVGLLANDDEEKLAEGEYLASAVAGADARTRLAGIESEFGRPPTLPADVPPAPGGPTPPPAPGAPPVPPTPPRGTPAVAAAEGAVAGTGLNGAQIAALLQIVTQVIEGGLPMEAAKAIVAASFPLLTPEEVAAIFNGVVEGSNPKTPPPTPPGGPPAGNQGA